MLINDGYIINRLGVSTFIEGKKLVDSGKVSRLELRPSLNGTMLAGSVDFYDPRADIHADCDKVDLSCSCIHGLLRGRCAHVAALLIAYSQRVTEQAAKFAESNAAGKRMLKSYSLPAVRKTEPAQLQLLLRLDDTVPMVSFKIGHSRMYAVRDLIGFAARMREGTAASYADDFQFEHSENNFDEFSRELCRFACSKAEALDAALSSQAGLRHYEQSPVRELPLSGRDFDRVFELFLKQGTIPNKSAGGRFRLYDGNPQLEVKISEANGFYRLEIEPSARAVRGGEYDYAVVGTSIYRLTGDYADAMLPLIRESASADEPLMLSESGAREFCLTVKPRIEKYTGDTAFEPLAELMPETLDVRYLIDMPERSRLTATADFTYDGKYVSAGATPDEYPDIRRNVLLEDEALNALDEFFDPPELKGAPHELTDEARIYEFLKHGTEQLAKHGDVYVTDRLKAMSLTRTVRPTVRVAVSGGMLDFKVDTGEFPQEELAQLMHCVREKRRYYRLRDGRFMGLENGEMDGLANTIDALGIDAKQLKYDAVSVPLYKAMYLDSALKQDTDVNVERNADFKRLIRDFKTVEDSDYAIPESLEKVLRSYQKTGYMWLRTLDTYRFGGILADDMGLGKTLEVLAYLLGKKQERKADSAEPHTSLIVCPASLVLNWGEEAVKWTPELRVCLLCGSAKERNIALLNADGYDIIITSYDLLRNDIEKHTLNRYYACILDEAQYIKNHETHTFKAVKQINACVRLALTGTPVENRLGELWSIFDYLMPGYLDKYTRFWDRFEKPIAQNDDKTARSTLGKLVSPFVLRRLKTDVLTELPPKTEMNCYIQMDDVQRKYYLAYANDIKKKLESSENKDKLQILAMLTRLRQLCCDPALCIENYEGGSCKSDECLRMAEELIQGGHRVLLFSQFTSMLSRLEAKFAEAGIETFTLRGDTPLNERARLIKRFNAGEADVFLISLKAGGTGLNLTGADTVIHYDPWWNVAAQNQATDRCYRIGQDKNVTVYKLIASDTIEDNIIKLQSRKMELAKVVTENADGGIMNMTKDELLQLIS